jgi:DNA-binding NarL/FixJ family response regulator
MKRIRVLLADDHALVRAGFRSLLEKIPAVTVVAEAGRGREAIELIKKHQPHIVLMDIAMPGLNGLEALTRCKDFPKTRVMILSMHATEEYVAQALRGGAAGYLIKDAAVAELKVAIQSVMKGETYLSASISRRVIDTYLKRVGDKSGPLDPLTSRQREVLQLMAEGNNTKEIAFVLKLSVKTVETHRGHLMTKLGIRDIAGLVRYAMRAGLVPAITTNLTSL